MLSPYGIQLSIALYIYWDDPQSVQLGNTNNISLDYFIFVSRGQEFMSIGLQKYTHPAT